MKKLKNQLCISHGHHPLMNVQVDKGQASMDLSGQPGLRGMHDEDEGEGEVAEEPPWHHRRGTPHSDNLSPTN
jgi:hypothetical protein